MLRDTLVELALGDSVDSLATRSTANGGELAARQVAETQSEPTLKMDPC